MIALVLCLGWVGAALAGPLGLDDIEFWVGTGSNRAGLVIDWNEGPSPQALAWGFRWDGEATGWDMLTAIAGQTDVYTWNEDSQDFDVDPIYGADPNLTVRATHFDFGPMVDGFEYESDDLSHPDTATAPNWWAYWVSEDGVEWHEPVDEHGFGLGATDRILSDGDWDGWGFELDWNVWPAENAPENPTPVPSSGSPPIPEPAGLTGLGLALTVILRRRRRIA